MVYASCLTDEDDNLIESWESFLLNRTRPKPDTYYFKTGALLKEYCQKLIDSGQTVNGEYYASVSYNFMVKDGIKV